MFSAGLNTILPLPFGNPPFLFARCRVLWVSVWVYASSLKRKGIKAKCASHPDAVALGSLEVIDCDNVVNCKSKIACSLIDTMVLHISGRSILGHLRTLDHHMVPRWFILVPCRILLVSGSIKKSALLICPLCRPVPVHSPIIPPASKESIYG